MNAICELNSNEAQLLSDKKSAHSGGGHIKTHSLQQNSSDDNVQFMDTGLAELNRVLGGGMPAGAVILLGGEPGIGKSTLLAQCCGRMHSDKDVLYISAEESINQVRDRFHRLECVSDKVQLASANDCEDIARSISSGVYALVVIDSIQLIVSKNIEGVPGSVSQVRSCAARLVEVAKASETTLILIGHVTKDGGLAGPRTLEHLVDTVLHFDGDRYQELRTLRAVKNRFGSTNELGLFSMDKHGLQEVKDASGLFIQDRHNDIPGSCVVPTLEGNRCVLVEIQALVNQTDFPQPARRVSGLDHNRVQMIIAVLSRRLNLRLGNCDIFVNVTGGAKVMEPSADLGIALAIASAWHDTPIPPDVAAIGEIGLGGEIRPASRYDIRASEARRLGFKHLLGPGKGSGAGRIKVDTVADAIIKYFS